MPETLSASHYAAARTCLARVRWYSRMVRAFRSPYVMAYVVDELVQADEHRSMAREARRAGL